ncbi:F-BAR domain only protein 2 [Macrobrachium rosenbergii]|uniref:F-BAR domain only protein 2 n=1 Tax=Macrobrachium rosenbergii TaxID=79674 RepID=UPI0034D4CE90
MAVDFCDYFWGEEHNGWNVLYQNMKQGQTASKELAEFFKERWSIDETYSKSLVKLANKASTNTEKGTCAPIFVVLRQSSEKLSNIHSHTVQRVQDLVKEVVKYSDDLHKKHKGVKDEESQTEEIVKTIQTTGGLAQKARETYSQRCQDLEKVRRDGASPKDVEKAEAKLRKAHDEYRGLVEKYNNIREEFEKRMTTSCMKFQTVEEAHLAQMLQFVQTYINLLQSNHEAMGQIHQDLLNQYSQFSIERLLDQFALSKHTGLEKPNPMLFEDAGSLGSAVSGQQSPEPEQSKSSLEDGGGGGGGGSSSGGGVLTGGNVPVKPVRKEGASKKMFLLDRASVFAIPRGIRSSPSTTTVSSGNQGGLGGNSRCGVTVNSVSTTTNTTSTITTVTSTTVTSTPTQDHKVSPEYKISASLYSGTARGSSNSSSCVTSNNSKPSRRTASLLNLFVASTSFSGRSEREWSAPPSCVSDGGAEDPNGDGLERGSESLPHSPAKVSPARVTSAPTSPSAVDDPSLARSVFRSSKLALTGGTPVISFGFLRSRRDKKKEKKTKKKKDNDSSSNKEEKSDNETNDDSGTKVAEIITTSMTAATDGANSTAQTPNVDEEGYSVRPEENKKSGNDNSFDSSSDSDSDGDVDKKIHVEIKPISNGNPPMSASVDELRATIEGMSLSAKSFPSPRVPPRQISSDGKIKIRYLTLQKTRRTSTDAQESFPPMKRSNSITQQLSGGKTSSADLLGLNFNFSGNSESSPKAVNKTVSGDTSLTRPMSPATNSLPGFVLEAHPIMDPRVATSSIAYCALDDLRAWSPQPVLPKGLKEPVRPCEESPPSIELPWPKLAKLVLGQVSSLFSGRENSFQASSSFKLLPPPLPRQKKSYKPSERSIPTAQIDLNLIHRGPSLSLEQLRAEDISLLHQESATLKTTAMAVFQAVSWMDHWSTTVAKVITSSLSLTNEEVANLNRMFLSGGRTITYLAHQTANLWADLTLKRRDVVLSRVSKFVSPESVLTLRNRPLLGSTSLFDREQVDTAVDCRRADDSDCLVHHEAAKTSGPSCATAALPSGQAGPSSTGPRKPQNPKVLHRNTQPGRENIHPQLTEGPPSGQGEEVFEEECCGSHDKSVSGLYSRIFLIEKASGRWRPVIDLSALNQFVRQTHFKMEMTCSVLTAIRESDMLTVDYRMLTDRDHPGIAINLEKSDLIPKQRIKYLGMLIDAAAVRVFPSDSCVSRFSYGKLLVMFFKLFMHIKGTEIILILNLLAELSDILNEVGDAPPALPPRTGSSSSRGSTPTPTMAIPRPPSRKALEGPSSRGRQSPSTVSGLSHADSVSSLEFRTSGMVGTSRGPSPLTIGLSDSIPLAVAFQELCHAYFRGTDESKCQVKVTGEMMVSFPAGIVNVLTNNPSPAQLSFKVNNFSKVSNVLPNKQLINMDSDQSTPECGVFHFNMNALTSLLRKQAESNPSASYFNVDMIKYQVSSLNGAQSSPLQLVTYWKCEDGHTDLRIDYKYNPYAITTPCALLNVNITVPVDGVVKNMQSKPSGQWLKDQQRAVWKLTELSQHSASAGVGSLRAKFEVAAGPSTPATVSAQFNCEGTTMSGLDFALSGSGYRVSLVKKRFVSGKYICDADAVLRLRYGSIPS